MVDVEWMGVEGSVGDEVVRGDEVFRNVERGQWSESEKRHL